MFMRSSLGHRKIQKSDIDEVKIRELHSLLERSYRCEPRDSTMGISLKNNYYFLVIVDAFRCVFLFRKRVWLRFDAASRCIKCFILAASERGCHAAIQTRLRRDFNAFHAIKKLHGR